ncbi:hypothetical protein GCM10025734_55050 [Kitasatospora paranensis]
MHAKLLPEIGGSFRRPVRWRRSTGGGVGGSGRPTGRLPVPTSPATRPPARRRGPPREDARVPARVLQDAPRNAPTHPKNDRARQEDTPTGSGSGRMGYMR